MPKIVVDSSLWIDFFNKKTSSQIEHLKSLLIERSTASPVIILPVIMQEVLQGIDKDQFFNLVKEDLEGLDFLYYKTYELTIEAARLYKSLRHKGITINKINDCLIAAICIDNKLPLFHNDKDFDNIAKHTSLKIYKTKNGKN
jgi:predicted nucleic acid-binding protein